MQVLRQLRHIAWRAEHTVKPQCLRAAEGGEQSAQRAKARFGQIGNARKCGILASAHDHAFALQIKHACHAINQPFAFEQGLRFIAAETARLAACKDGA